MIKQGRLIFGLFLGSLAATLCAGTYGGGSGTAADPYKIASKADLLELAKTPTDYDKCFILTTNIDLAGEIFTQAIIAPDPGDSIVIDPGNWRKTVVFQGIAFTGIFDGNGHQIKNMYIAFDDESEYNDLKGLFGYVGQGGTIRNMTLINATIEGGECTGILAGYNAGSVINCSCTGTVNGDEIGGGLAGGNSGTISLSRAQVDIDGTQTWGGLVGQNEGIIQSCCSVGMIIGFWDIGGLVGDNYGTILYSYSTGVITVYNASYSECVGGLVGWNNNGSIFNCYSSNTITAQGNYASYYGGLVGDNSGVIERCYSTGKIIPGENAGYVGGLIGYTTKNIADCFWDVQTSGQSESAGGVGMTTTQMKMLLTFIPVGWDFLGEAANGTEDIWRMCVDGVDYPRLSWEKSIRGDFSCPDGVGGDDLQQLIQDWLSTYSAGFRGSDANGDREVNLNDLAVLAKHWMQQ